MKRAMACTYLCWQHTGFPRICLGHGRYRWQCAAEVPVISLIVSRYQGIDVLLLVGELLRKTAFRVNEKADCLREAGQSVAHSSSAWVHAGIFCKSDRKSGWSVVICLLVSHTQSQCHWVYSKSAHVNGRGASNSFKHSTPIISSSACF